MPRYILHLDYQVQIDYVSGEWWIGKIEDGKWVAQIPTDAGGYLDRLGEQAMAQLLVPNPKSCMVIESAPIGSLIGRIGTNGVIFSVGNSLGFVAQESDILFLRINYNYDERSPYKDSFLIEQGETCPRLSGGTILVRVAVTPP